MRLTLPEPCYAAHPRYEMCRPRWALAVVLAFWDGVNGPLEMPLRGLCVVYEG